MKFNLADLFKKTNKKGLEAIQLYCQNPRCRNPLITKEEECVAEVNGNLVHSYNECIEMYMVHEAIKTRDIVICPSINRIPYSKAKKLALKDKVKYSRLENKTGEEK